MVSGESQPFSSWAMASADITADCFCSSGYLATSRSIFIRASSLSIFRASSVYFTEHDVLGADDGHHVGDHVPARHLVERGKVRESRRAQLHAIRLVGAVGHDVDAELALGVLDRGVGLAGRHMHALAEE